MTQEQQEAKRRAEVMLAFADGASIEWRIADGGVVWGEDDSPSWEWKSLDYRVNPNPVVNWDAMPAWALRIQVQGWRLVVVYSRAFFGRK